ncbi:uncharacterized protein LOC118412968 [Branchiostoma floridae]|uniref:Uncharacterized protein LOC118412968 n=1 Tax=Branchiostoma floridae TaxID=7739 RepID=A0A9J7KYK7_BRAFL|nr:uncharacterized protein LOC118412968 [Branchiostoma floridae]
MASTEELVPVRRRRCPAWCSCGSCRCSCGSFWWTRWLRKRLERPLGAHSVVDFFLGIFVTVSVLVFAIQSVLNAMTNCDVRSETLPIIFTALVCVGIPCVAAIGFVIRRDPFMRDDAAGGGGTEGLELSLLFAPIVLLAVGCVTLDAVFFLLVGACIHRDEGTFPTLAFYWTGTAFHVGRMVFVVAQVAMFGWCFKTRSFARQKVYTVLLFTAVVMADLASWFYEIVDKPSALCTRGVSACWDTTVTKSKSYTCQEISNVNNIFTEEYCTFVQFQLYCQPLVGTFALLSLPTMYYMWSKAREGEGGGATDSGEEQTNRPGASLTALA